MRGEYLNGEHPCRLPIPDDLKPYVEGFDPLFARWRIAWSRAIDQVLAFEDFRRDPESDLATILAIEELHGVTHA